MADKTRKESSAKKWTRRSFLATAGVVGGGLALGLTLSPNRLKMQSSSAVEEDEVHLNTWVKISPDNKITVFFPHSEMGQGAGTGLAQMLAEEMEADWDTVSIEQAPVSDEYINSDLGRGYIVGEGTNIPAFIYPMLDFTFLQLSKSLVGQITGGSTAIRLTGQHGMRRAGAAAKEMLIKAAAEKWDVSASSLTARGSMVVHATSGREATFGELATLAAKFTPNLKPALKAPADFNIVGTSKPRLDLPEKVDGSAQYGIDVVVPGMVYAAIALPPVQGARASSVSSSNAQSGKGVQKILNLEDAVAVVADSFWTASKALEDMEISWEGGHTDLSSASMHAQHQQDLENGDLETMASAGSPGKALSSGTSLSATFDVPFLAHAAMEPLNCTVARSKDGAEIWAGAQNQLFARNAAAEVMGLEPTSIKMHPVYLGGGFGRRAETDFVTIAARIALQLDAPVKVIWSRENDMANDMYRPAVLSQMEGSVENGRISAVKHRYIDARAGMPDSERPFEFQYDVPNLEIARVVCPCPIPVGTWRSVDFTQIGFFHEAFMDELAEAASADPLAFRLAHTSNPRRRAVLERLAKESNWGAALPSGHGRGVAMVESFGTIVAQAVEVRVEDDGGVGVNRVTSVVDCGQLVNPDSGEAQITGSVIFGLTSALFGEITVEGGQIQQANFPDYDMLRLENAPGQTVHFIKSDHPPGGLGEPGVPPITPALTNAIYQVTGERVRSLPIHKHGLYAL